MSLDLIRINVSDASIYMSCFAIHAQFSRQNDTYLVVDAAVLTEWVNQEKFDIWVSKFELCKTEQNYVRVQYSMKILTPLSCVHFMQKCFCFFAFRLMCVLEMHTISEQAEKTFRPA